MFLKNCIVTCLLVCFALFAITAATEPKKKQVRYNKHKLALLSLRSLTNDKFVPIEVGKLQQIKDEKKPGFIFTSLEVTEAQGTCKETPPKIVCEPVADAKKRQEKKCTLFIFINRNVDKVTSMNDIQIHKEKTTCGKQTPA